MLKSGLLLLMICPLFAQEDTGEWIVGLRVGHSDFSDLKDCIDCEPEDIEEDEGAIDDSNFGYGLVFGYNFNEYIGLELAWHNFGAWKKDLSQAGGSSENAKVEFGVQSIPVFAVGKIPFNDIFSVHAKAGYHFYRAEIDYDQTQEDFTDTSENDKEFAWSVGFTTQFIDSMSISFDYERLDISFDKFNLEGEGFDLSSITLSAKYHF